MICSRHLSIRSIASGVVISILSVGGTTATVAPASAATYSCQASSAWSAPAIPVGTPSWEYSRMHTRSYAIKSYDTTTFDRKVKGRADVSFDGINGTITGTVKITIRQQYVSLVPKRSVNKHKDDTFYFTLESASGGGPGGESFHTSEVDAIGGDVKVIVTLIPIQPLTNPASISASIPWVEPGCDE